MDTETLSIRSIREERKTSPAELASALGIPTSTLRSYENGHRASPVRLLVALTDYYGLLPFESVRLMRWAAKVAQ